MRERIYEMDAAKRRCLVVSNLRKFPNADNQGHEPGLFDPVSNQWLIVRSSRIPGPAPRRVVGTRKLSPSEGIAFEACLRAHP